MYRGLGVISISIIWLGLLILIKKWPGNRSMTFSQHAAQKKVAIAYYFLLFALTMPMFYLFMTRWFVPTFNLPVLFTRVLAVGVFMQMVAVTVPETKGVKVFIHRNSAFLMSLLLMPLLIIVITSSDVGVIARSVSIIALMIQVTIATITIPKNGYHKNVLFLQATYIAVFHIAIIAAVYT